MTLILRNEKQVLKAVAEAIHLYNNERPHNSLQKRKPAQVHFTAA